MKKYGIENPVDKIDCKFIFCTSNPPKITGNSKGIWRRLKTNYSRRNIMTYIRTKYGIWEVARETKDFVYVRQNPSEIGLIKGPQYESGYPMSEIIKQADNIEELFDEFVFVDEFGKKDLLNDDYKEKLQKYGAFIVVYALLKQDRPKELYGAIWTDKGLIYVAKMNERLDMELI